MSTLSSKSISSLEPNLGYGELASLLSQGAHDAHNLYDHLTHRTTGCTEHALQRAFELIFKRHAHNSFVEKAFTLMVLAVAVVPRKTSLQLENSMLYSGKKMIVRGKKWNLQSLWLFELTLLLKMGGSNGHSKSIL